MQQQGLVNLHMSLESGLGNSVLSRVARENNAIHNYMHGPKIFFNYKASSPTKKGEVQKPVILVDDAREILEERRFLNYEAGVNIEGI